MAEVDSVGAEDLGVAEDSVAGRRVWRWRELGGRPSPSESPAGQHL